MLKEVSWVPTKPDLSGFLDKKAIKAAKNLLRSESVSMRNLETVTSKRRLPGVNDSRDSDDDDDDDFPSGGFGVHSSLPSVSIDRQGSFAMEGKMMIERLLSTRLQLQSQGSMRLGSPHCGGSMGERL